MTAPAAAARRVRGLPPARPAAALLLVAAVVARAAVAGSTADPASPEPAAPAPAVSLGLVLADWTAGAFGREAGGYLAWVEGPGGDLRVEVLEPGDGAAPPAGAAAPAASRDAEALAALLGRQGRGWTVVAGAGDEPGILAPWDREWRPAPPGLGRLARAVAAAAAAPGSRARLELAAPAAPGRSEVGQGPPPGPAGGLRAVLVARGRGGGGPGERLAVEGRPDGAVLVTSSRRPGTLAIRPRPARSLAGDPAAVFLPWWPLGEVLSPAPGSETGTSPGAAR